MNYKLCLTSISRMIYNDIQLIIEGVMNPCINLFSRVIYRDSFFFAVKARTNFVGGKGHEI